LGNYGDYCSKTTEADAVMGGGGTGPQGFICVRGHRIEYRQFAIM